MVNYHFTIFHKGAVHDPFTNSAVDVGQTEGNVIFGEEHLELSYRDETAGDKMFEPYI
jgi:hypothetical protein